MGLTIDKREVSGIVVIDLAGDSTISDGSIIQQTVRKLTEEGKRWFILNLQNLRYVDSFGLGQFVSSFIAVRDLKGGMRVVNPNSKVRDLLKYTRIDTVLQIMPGETEALADLQKQASS